MLDMKSCSVKRPIVMVESRPHYWVLLSYIRVAYCVFYSSSTASAFLLDLLNCSFPSEMYAWTF